ncbi:hypothetical protein F5880DRAFT_657790 [Lentinula raphanica]|nr:hypothetical protein F5880DRAFT_657790 [Lentinula raphanica]
MALDKSSVLRNSLQASTGVYSADFSLWVAIYRTQTIWITIAMLHFPLKFNVEHWNWILKNPLRALTSNSRFLQRLLLTQILFVPIIYLYLPWIFQCTQQDAASSPLSRNAATNVKAQTVRLCPSSPSCIMTFKPICMKHVNSH